MTFSELFIDVHSLPDNVYGLFQLVCIGGTYGYILCVSSGLISDGSELLLLVPSTAGLVGSVVLPILGAVPDGCIVLFSGLGDQAQDTLNVGVGALAGSTIMLLTVPWFLSVLGGRVNIDPQTGSARYRVPKLSPPNNMSLTETGVGVSEVIQKGGYVMMLSAIPYVVLQLPGMFYDSLPVAQQAVGESYWALLGFILCVAIFFGYLAYQYKISDHDSNQNQLRDEFLLNAIAENKITLITVIYLELGSAGFDWNFTTSRPESAGIQASESTPLGSGDHIPTKALSRLESLLTPYFKRYDTDSSGLLDLSELTYVLRDLGEKNIEQARDMQKIFGLAAVNTFLCFISFLNILYRAMEGSTTRILSE